MADYFSLQENNGLQLHDRPAERPFQPPPLNDSYYHPQNQIPFPSREHQQPTQPYYNHQEHTTTHSQYPSRKPPTDMESPTTPKTAKHRHSYRPSAQYRLERTRVLSNTPVDTLIQQLIQQEHEAKEGRRLLRTALTKLETLQNRTRTAEAAYRELESGQTTRGLKTVKNMMSVQEEVVRAQHDAGVYKVYLEQTQKELQEKQQALKSVSSQRDTAEKLAKKATEIVRQLNDERLIASAREEGRRMGYDEGVRQGRTLGLTGSGDGGNTRHGHFIDHRRVLPHQTPIGSGAAFIEEYDGNESEPDGGGRRSNRRGGVAGTAGTGRGRSTNTHTPRSQPVNPSAVPTRTTTPAMAVHQEVPAVVIDPLDDKIELESERLRQLELDREREKERVEKQERERRVLEEELKLAKEKEREAVRRREVELELDREKEREKVLILEKERDEEKRRREEREGELERERKRVKELELEREREREREREERKEKEREQELEREKQKERDRDRDAGSSNSSVSQQAASVRSPSGGRLPYLRMPQPPRPPVATASSTEPQAATGTETPPPLRVPPPRWKATPPAPIRVPHQQIQPYPYPRGTGGGHRRTVSSPDTTTSTMSNDMITFPSGTVRGANDWPRRTDLSDIPEVPSVRSRNSEEINDAAHGASPAWLNNPPPVLTSPAMERKKKSGPDIEVWRRSTASGYHPHDTTGSADRNYLTPSFQPGDQTRGQSPYSHGRHSHGSSGSTINITVESPSRPPSSIAMDGQETAGFLSPFHPPLALVPEEPTMPEPRTVEPPVVPVIPSVVDADLTNFPPAGFVPYRNPTNGTESTSSDRQPFPTKGNRSTYRDFTPGGGANGGSGPYQRPPSRTGASIYANVPPNGASNYASQNQTPRHTPRQIYGAPLPPSGRPQTYAPTSSSTTTASQTPRHAARQIYGPPVPPGGNVNRPLHQQQPNDRETSRIYGPPTNKRGEYAAGAAPRTQIYATTSPNAFSQTPLPYGPGVGGGDPVIPPPPKSSIYGPAPPAGRSSSVGAGLTRSGPVIPPPVPGTPSSRANAYLYSPSGTPKPFIPPILPGRAGSGGGGSMATPRTRSRGIRENEYAEEEDEDDGIDHDEETLRNTEANRVYGRGSPHVMGMQMPLPIPPPGVVR